MRWNFFNIRSDNTDQHHTDLVTINIMLSFQQFLQISIVNNTVVVVLIEIVWLWF